MKRRQRQEIQLIPAGVGWGRIAPPSAAVPGAGWLAGFCAVSAVGTAALAQHREKHALPTSTPERISAVPMAVQPTAR